MQMGFNLTKIVKKSMIHARLIYPLKLMQCRSPNLYLKNIGREVLVLGVVKINLTIFRTSNFELKML